MQIKLLKRVLVEDHHVESTPKDTVVDLDDAKAKEFIELGLAEATKKAPAPANKMAAEPVNKSKGK
jgi:hypothetical protein